MNFNLLFTVPNLYVFVITAIRSALNVTLRLPSVGFDKITIEMGNCGKGSQFSFWTCDSVSFR